MWRVIPFCARLSRQLALRELISLAWSGSAAFTGCEFLDPGQTGMGFGAVGIDSEGRPVFSLRFGCVTHRFVPEAQGTVGGGVTRPKLLGFTERCPGPF